MVEEIKNKVISVLTGGDSDSFIKRNLFSSEFFLLLIYVGMIYANGAFLNNTVTDTAMNRIEVIVFSWTGMRQVGKAVSYQVNSKSKD